MAENNLGGFNSEPEKEMNKFFETYVPSKIDKKIDTKTKNKFQFN